MQLEEASREINKLIKVTHNEIGLAKAYILEYCRSNKERQLASIAGEINVPIAKRLFPINEV